ncbi:MAG TPA: hypothetical protein VGM90_27825 [Kofleriaceae bacterium]|jgi:hypothetical protein
MNTSRHQVTPATLEPVRFGEFLRDRQLISEEQWLAALAQHWSEPLDARRGISWGRRLIGTTIIENGYLPAEVVESEARVFHDDLDVVEIVDVQDGRAEKVTLPIPSVKMTIRA